jgi:hypothetical protein
VAELVVEMVVVVELGLAMLFTPKPLTGFEEDRLAGPVMVRVAGLVVMEVVLSGAVVCIKGWVAMCTKVGGLMRPIPALKGRVVVLVLEGMVWLEETGNVPTCVDLLPWLLVGVTKRLFIMKPAEAGPGPVGEEWVVSVLPSGFGFTRSGQRRLCSLADTTISRRREDVVSIGETGEKGCACPWEGAEDVGRPCVADAAACSGGGWEISIGVTAE